MTSVPVSFCVSPLGGGVSVNSKLCDNSWPPCLRSRPVSCSVWESLGDVKGGNASLFWVGGRFVSAVWLSPERGSSGLVPCSLWSLGRFNSVLLNSALLGSFISLIASPITRATFRTYSFNLHRARSHLSYLSIISRNISPQLHGHSHSLCAIWDLVPKYGRQVVFQEQCQHTYSSPIKLL